MSDDSTTAAPQDYSKQARHIWLGGFALMAGSAVSYGLFLLTSSTHSHIVLSLMIAAVQAGFQLLVFMHLKNERGIIFKFLAFTLFFVMALFVLTHLHESDPLHDSAFYTN